MIDPVDTRPVSEKGRLPGHPDLTDVPSSAVAPNDSPATLRLRRAIDGCLPPAILAGAPEAIRVARLTVVLLVTLAASGFSIGCVALLIGRAGLATLIELTVAMHLVALVVLGRTGRLAISAYLSLSALAFALVLGAAVTGGVYSPALIWLPTFPVLATLLLGRRGGTPWLIVSILPAAGFAVSDLVGIEAFPPMSASTLRIGNVTEVVGATMVLWGLARAFEATKDRMARELERERATVELARDSANDAHAAARRILDAIDEALFVVRADGSVEPEVSHAARTWFGTPDGLPVWEWLAPDDAHQAGWLRLGWEAVTDGVLPLDVALHQVPSRLTRAERTFDIRWLFDPASNDALVVVSDLTERLETERAERARRDLVNALQRRMDDRGGFFEFVTEARRLMDGLVEGRDPASAGADLHTLKGISAQMGLESFAELCHEVESDLAEVGDGRLRTGHLDRLHGAWSELTSSLEQFMDPRGIEAIEVAPDEFDQALAAIDAGAPSEVLRGMLERWRSEPAKTRLEQMAWHARRLASRMDKEPMRVTIHDGDVRLKPHSATQFWPTLVHVLRNAIDHGLEGPTERAANGKPEEGHLELSSRVDGDEVVISIRDDGRGVQWDRLAAAAARAGIPSEGREHLLGALFAHGVSSAREVTPISGRGLGMAAVKREAERLGGRILVESTAGQGTVFEFRLPRTRVAG